MISPITTIHPRPSLSIKRAKRAADGTRGEKTWVWMGSCVKAAGEALCVKSRFLTTCRVQMFQVLLALEDPLLPPDVI